MSALGPTTLLAVNPIWISLRLKMLPTLSATFLELFSGSATSLAYRLVGLAFFCVTFGIENKAQSCTAWMGRANVHVPCRVGISCSIEEALASWVPSTPGDVGSMSWSWSGSLGPDHSPLSLRPLLCGHSVGLVSAMDTSPWTEGGLGSLLELSQLGASAVYRSDSVQDTRGLKVSEKGFPVGLLGKGLGVWFLHSVSRSSLVLLFIF